MFNAKEPSNVSLSEGEEIGVYTPGMIMASSYEEAQNNAMQARESEMRARERKNIEGQAGRFVDGLLGVFSSECETNQVLVFGVYFLRRYAQR